MKKTKEGGIEILEGMEVINLAKFMHDKYEEFAKEIGWKTQDSCKVEFNDLPPKNRKVMLLIAAEVLKYFKSRIVAKK